jgi:hypothetical protein
MRSARRAICGLFHPIPHPYYDHLLRQQVVSHHFWFEEGGRQARLFRSPHRYIWPAELDLMAQLAGMRLRERWGGWKREPFTSDSRKHVSVWSKEQDA